MPGEVDLEDVARRELREETGVEARHWQPLGAVDLNNGVTTDVEHLFLATGLEIRENDLDPVPILKAIHHGGTESRRRMMIDCWLVIVHRQALH